MKYLQAKLLLSGYFFKECYSSDWCVAKWKYFDFHLIGLKLPQHIGSMYGVFLIYWCVLNSNGWQSELETVLIRSGVKAL